MMINFGQTSKSENEKCKRLSEKSHNYSHCRQEKCFSLSLYPMVNVLSLSVDDDEIINVKMMMMVYFFRSLFCVSLLFS